MALVAKSKIAALLIAPIRGPRRRERGDIDEEVAPILSGGRHEPLLRDNCIRFDSDEASYRRLKPVFDRQYGTVTAANASPMTDGAAACC